MERNHAPQPTDWNSTLYDRQLGFVSAYGMGAVDWLAPRPASMCSTSAAGRAI